MLDRSNPGSSPASSNGSVTSMVLTPGKKVKALLAQFDDSESEEEITKPQSPTENCPSTGDLGQDDRRRRIDEHVNQNSSDDEDVLPTAPRGNLAARMQTRIENTSFSGSGLDEEHGRAAQPQSPAQRAGKSASGSSEDELSRPTLKRHLLKRNSSPAGINENLASRSRSASLQLFPSPPTGRAIGVDNATVDWGDSAEKPVDNSRFKALVEKHRRARLAKEAENDARKAARAEQMKNLTARARAAQNPTLAVESDEESDLSGDAAVNRIASQPRTSRKAGKKAQEEMKRETQRMSRNMQLAHQARTKKKITKESFLARFSNQPSSPAAAGKSRTASSNPTSDAEGTKDQTTPPTSPLQAASPNMKSPKFVSTPAENVEPLFRANVDEMELATFDDIQTHPETFLDKGKGKPTNFHLTPPLAVAPRVRWQHRSIRIKWSKEDAETAQAADSDSDLEIITSKSTTRKFAVFEKLPKRTATEAHSHLMLRSLAQLIEKDKTNKATANAAEMEASLRRAARMQAMKMREERIEDLKAKGVVIQSAAERERDQREVEDIVERARQEAVEIQRREKEIAKKNGTFVKDGLGDDSDDDEDADFEAEDADEPDELSGSEGVEAEEDEEEDADETEEGDGAEANLLVDEQAEEQESGEASSNGESEVYSASESDDMRMDVDEVPARKPRASRIVESDSEEDNNIENESPITGRAAKTPQSLSRSARKQIPGLQMSDDLPMALSQAFAATMADSQTQDPASQAEEPDSFILTADLPEPRFSFAPQLNRLESIDVVSDSQPATQTQLLDFTFGISQSQHISQSPPGLGISGTEFSFSQMPFEPTQDAGYMFSPFAGNRFEEDTPKHQAPHSTLETVVLSQGGVVEDSPVLQRKGRLRRGPIAAADSDEDSLRVAPSEDSAFELMRQAAKAKAAHTSFDKSKSNAREIVDEAAEESEDEYAGLGGASDEDVNDVEDEDDRQMIDHDTQLGRGEEAELAGLYADRERKSNEAAVSKLLKDITTGALRRKRGLAEDLDLSDEEGEEVRRRREVKRRQFARMRRELLKDEAVGKIAEDKKKQAFLKSIEDRDDADEEDEDGDFDQPETPLDGDSQSQPQAQALQGAQQDDSTTVIDTIDNTTLSRKRPLEPSTDYHLNCLQAPPRRTGVPTSKRPSTLAEIREQVSFLIEEVGSQSLDVDLGLSDDSEDEPESYVNLDRHLAMAEADENADDGEDLGDFIVEDDGEEQELEFAKPAAPPKRVPFTERRAPRENVVDRLSLLRRASSSSSSTASSSSAASSGSHGAKMAFFTSTVNSAFGKVPSLLRRATANNSSFGSMAGRLPSSSEHVSATGVTTAAGYHHGKERGDAAAEKEFVRKGNGGRRNAVNFCAKPSLKDEVMHARTGAGVRKPKTKGGSKAGGGSGSGFLGALFRSDSWE